MKLSEKQKGVEKLKIENWTRRVRRESRHKTAKGKEAKGKKKKQVPHLARLHGVMNATERD